MRGMIGYCGLDCEACDAYLATIHDDQALREKTAALWAELNQAPILPEHINCEGCRVDGVKTVFCEQMCAVRRCAQEKGDGNLRQLRRDGDLRKCGAQFSPAALGRGTISVVEHAKNQAEKL